MKITKFSKSVNETLDSSKLYSTEEAISMLMSFKRESFNESVDVAFNFAQCLIKASLILCLFERALTCTFAVGTDLNLYLLCASTRRMSHPTDEVLPATPTDGVDDDIERITCGDDFSLISCL